MSMFSTAMFLDTMENCCRNIHDWAKKKGFWDEEKLVQIIEGGSMWEKRGIVPWNFGEKIALIHSELSEVLEDHRNWNRGYKEFKMNEILYEDPGDGVWERADDNNPPLPNAKPVGIAIELADVVIRIMDLCGKMEIDLGRAILTKMEYNRTRPIKHGKAY